MNVHASRQPANPSIDTLDDADRNQTQRACQVFGQAHDLRAFNSGGGFNLIAGDNRARRGGHHAHFNAEVFEFFLNQARCHFQRFGRYAFLF